MRAYLLLAGWTLAAGAGIPLIGVLTSGISRSVGNPFAATAIVFGVALLAASVIALSCYGLPSAPRIAGAPPISYAAGFLIAFYALSATIIIPRFGAASFVAFILIAQLATSAMIDQFGLFGMARRPVDAVRIAGLAVILCGIVILELGNLRGGRS